MARWDILPNSAKEGAGQAAQRALSAISAEVWGTSVDTVPVVVTEVVPRGVPVVAPVVVLAPVVQDQEL